MKAQEIFQLWFTLLRLAGGRIGVSVLDKTLVLPKKSRVGTILPARVNPPHKTRVYPGWAIRSYYPLWAICGFYEFLVLLILGFQSDD